MPDFQKVQRQIQLPKGIGIDGYLAAIREVLLKGRIQQLLLELGGRVTYVRLLRDDEPEDTATIDPQGIMPYHVIRNKELEEVQWQHSPKAADGSYALGAMFHAAAQDGLTPIAFVGGAASKTRAWYEKTTGMRLVGQDIYGLPFLQDGDIPDDALLLCAAHARQAPLSATQKSYKITIPRS